MSEIEIGLGTIVGDVDFPMLKGTHRSRIDIEIGIEFPEAYAIAASLQKRTKCGRRKTFSEGRDHAAGDKDQPRHGRPTWLKWSLYSSPI